MASLYPITLLRPAGEEERRCIIRHDLGFYGYITVGGLYVFNGRHEPSERSVFISALKYCIKRHAILSASIQNPDSEKPSYVRPSALDLDNHIQFLEPLQMETLNDPGKQALDHFAQAVNDMPCSYRERIPAWKVVILPLMEASQSAAKRFWIGFCYSHSHGDGKSSLAFHHAYIEGLRADHAAQSPSKTLLTSTLPPLLPSLEDSADLTISWSFLLSPLLSVYLPTWLSSILGLQVGIGANDDAWKAKPATYDRENHHTGFSILSIQSELLKNILKACKQRGVTFSGILHQAIVFGLHRQLSSHAIGGSSPKFIGVTPLDLRRLVPGVGDDDMINCFSGAFNCLGAHTYESHLENGIAEPVWEAARQTSAFLAEKSSTLADQPIGLLKYLKNFRKYMLDQIGKEREGSYELSNVGVFNPVAPGGYADEAGWKVEKMVFLQPANAIGSAMGFNVVSVHGGDCVVTATWQRKVLGVDDEDAFVEGALRGARELLESVGKV